MAEVYRIAHQGDSAGQAIMNISWWKKLTTDDLPLSLADLTAILTEAASRYVTWFVPLFNSGYTYRRSVLVEVNGFETLDPLPGSDEPRHRPTASRQVLNVVGSGTTGSSATELLPNTLAAPVHWLTGRYGRRRRGRWKIGPFDKADVNGQKLTTAAATAVSSAAAAYIDPIVVGDPAKQINMSVMSLTDLYDTAPPGNPYEHAVFVTDYVVQSTLGTQRTRKLREAST